MSGWNLSEIPKEVFENFLVRVLILSNNKLSCLTPDMGQLQHLRVLMINHNKVNKAGQIIMFAIEDGIW